MLKFSDPRTIFIIDGSSFLYRAYYALKPMHTPAGAPVGAVYGFCRMLKKLIDTCNPQHLVLTWDSKGVTERHQIHPLYKATRQEAPSDIFVQKKLIEQVAQTIGILQVKKEGIEADDIMHSLAHDFSKHNYPIVLVTSDKDMGQIVSESIVIYDTFKEEILDTKAITEKYGFPPEKIPFYFSLVGDTSDNIPGVKGIGSKGATELVKQFASLQDLYQHIDTIHKERTRSLLLQNKDNAFLSEKLFLLRYYDLGISISETQFNSEQWNQARALFEALSFKSLVKDIPGQQETVVLSKQHKFTFTAITSEEELKKLCKEIEKNKHCAVDTETDTVIATQAHLVGVSFSYEVGKSYYIPVGHKNILLQLPYDNVIKHIKPLLENPDIKKYFHNAKFDQLVLAQCGIEVQGIVFDTLLAAHLVTLDGQRINLKALSASLLQQEMITFNDIMALGDFENFSYVPLELATEYAAADAHQTLQLVPVLQEKLQQQNQEDLYKSIELPLVQTLYEMEKEGIIVNQSVLQKVNIHVTRELEVIRGQIVAFLGEKYTDVNLNSPKQIGEILFTTLKLEPVKKTSKKTAYSTDQEVLAELAKIHPIPGLIVKYRELFKLKSTYLDSLPRYINPTTGKIHTNFSQTATATGRLASSEPNLQNIPLETNEKLSVRAAFCAPEGELFISADYSQIELRVLAYLSQDEHLVQAFLNNEDIHLHTAAGIFGVPQEQVTHEQRQLGKRINFSILYGLTPYGLSKDLAISYADAQTYIEKYFEQYPKVSVWMASVIEETKKNGYVTTLFGRRRYVPGIYEKNKTLYDLAHRITINTRAQGTAAELMKIGMNNLRTQLAKANHGAKIILQIHDELLISVPQEQVIVTEKMIVDVLQNVVSWNIPLTVTTKTGKTWLDVSK